MRDIHEDAQGRWKGLILESGIANAAAIVAGKHMPCPMCGGADRFRYSDYQGRGNYYCNHCGAGTGIDLIMKAQGKTFTQAATLVRSLLHMAPVEVVKAKDRNSSAEYVEHLWRSGERLTGDDPASLYLRARGIDPVNTLLELRCAKRVKWSEKDQATSYHPAMVARFVAPDASTKTVHVTYLNHEGGKASVLKPKKLAPAPVPKGGAVRLSKSAETMGIAEGVETAISAQRLFEVPVWAALSAGEMIKWKPPEGAKCIMVFGDNDSSYAGQNAAYSLAFRLRSEGRHVDVRVPDEVDTDWNDVLCANR